VNPNENKPFSLDFLVKLLKGIFWFDPLRPQMVNHTSPHTSSVKIACTNGHNNKKEGTDCSVFFSSNYPLKESKMWRAMGSFANFVAPIGVCKQVWDEYLFSLQMLISSTNMPFRIQTD